MWFFSGFALVKRFEWAVSLALVIMAYALSFAASQQISAERSRTHQAQIDNLVADFQAQLRSREFVIEQLENGLTLTPALNSQVWNRLAQGFVREYPESPGIGWVDLIAGSQLQSLQGEFDRRDVQLKQWNPDLTIGPLEERGEYAILSHLAAVQASSNALGLDLLSEPQRALMLRRAISTNKTVISQPVELSTHRGQTAILLAHPVRAQPLSGFITTAFLTVPLIQRLLPKIEYPGQLVILDPSNPNRPLYSSGIRAEGVRGLEQHQASVEFGQRTWSITLHRSADSLPFWPNWIWLTALIGSAVVLGFTARYRHNEVHYQKRLKQATFELTQSNTALTHKNRELESFAYAASHDLQAPLRGIRNLSQWLSEDLEPRHLSPESQDLLTRLSRLSTRMSDMITGLLNYSRVNDQNSVLEWIRIDSLVAEVASELPLKQIHIDVPWEFNTYRLSIRRVLSILIENAFAHNTEAVQLWITTVPGNPNALWIADDGKGIPGHQADRMFEMFQTLAADQEDEVRGMGLPTARKIIRSLNGSLELVKHPQLTGACFELAWPCSKRRIES